MQKGNKAKSTEFLGKLRFLSEATGNDPSFAQGYGGQVRKDHRDKPTMTLFLDIWSILRKIVACG
jgi:hypothetical protein